MSYGVYDVHLSSAALQQLTHHNKGFPCRKSATQQLVVVVPILQASRLLTFIWEGPKARYRKANTNLDFLYTP